MNQRIQDWKDTTWQIRPALNMPELDPEVVQFALLDSNPLEQYRKLLTEHGDKLRKEAGEEADLTQRDELRKAQLTVLWDGLFRATTGDLVYLLTPLHTKSASFARALVISSNEPAGLKWLTTKIVYRDRTPICWCIPVNTAIGESAALELRSGNALDISKVFDEIIGLN